ncbi:MAG TPA: glycoside hydrolase family 2 TIM barrel-domain containing protein, partial [Verrucomicrobiae bacterium]|nr:glycoside hydrolase family 2 TIM barrel-domain containing protein [Verrucomicrobiae bacterium]
MKRRCKLVKTICLATLFALPFFGRAEDTNSPDTFADIAAGSSGAPNHGLVTPQPPKLPHKIIRYGQDDPDAVFQPAEKLDTAEKLTNALAEMRSTFAPFLEDHAPSQNETRKIDTLTNFDWRIATPDDWQNFPGVLAGSGEWTSVKIPHFGEPLGKTNTFYRTTFTLDAWQTNEAVFVRFRGVDYKAHVFVNGAYVGSHEGFFAPFEFDVTRSVHTGSNTLFVQVDNDFPTLGVVNDPKYPDLIGDKIYAATGSGFDEPNAGWHHDPPGMGINQPVTVEVRPRVHVHDIFVRPLPEEKAAEALVELWNCDVGTNPVKITFAVHGLNFQQQVIAAQKVEKPDAACSGISFYRIKFPMKDFRWWSPDSPWLYDFQVTVSCPKLGTTDNAHRHFGMRSFRMDEVNIPKGRIYLNGEEIRLRGANTMGFEQQDVRRGDSNQLRDDLLLAKIAHMNFLRITQRPVPEEVYEMADRLGLMIQTDFPLFA